MRSAALSLPFFGGHGCHAYNEETGREVAYWNIGDFAETNASFEEVEENFTEHVQTGDYLDLYGSQRY
jgi:hypothetical protein